jgi:hypothetical protein
MRNLLVVDFDYFFLNKLEGGYLDDEMMLYDWQHNESEMYRTILWPGRGADFIINDLPLPKVNIPEDWWSRFNISPDAVCEVSDSNMYSGAADGHSTFDHVWLYDAHHDLYKIKTVEQLADWEKKSQISCEDWMFAHYLRGSKLHWRWPQWHREAKGMRANIPKWVGLDARRDDLGSLDMQFDAVSICRSGCWVPSWCDDDFISFVESCPVSEIVEVEDGVMEPREWREFLDRTVEMRRNMDKLLKEEAK